MGLEFVELPKEDATPMASSQRSGDPPTPEPPSVVRMLAHPTAEANWFLEAVWREFADQRDKFELFRAALVDYYHMNIDMASLVDRMQVMLHGYPDLVRGFNIFLPSGFALQYDLQGEGPSGHGDA